MVPGMGVVRAAVGAGEQPEPANTVAVTTQDRYTLPVAPALDGAGQNRSFPGLPPVGDGPLRAASPPPVSQIGNPGPKKITTGLT